MLGPGPEVYLDSEKQKNRKTQIARQAQAKAAKPPSLQGLPRKTEKQKNRKTEKQELPARLKPGQPSLQGLPRKTEKPKNRKTEKHKIRKCQTRSGLDPRPPGTPLGL